VASPAGHRALESRSLRASHRDAGQIRRVFADLREAEVEDCDDAGGRYLDVRGLKSRWTIPRSCAASRPSAVCRDVGGGCRRHAAVVRRAAREVLGERLRLDQLQHQRAHGSTVGAYGVLDAVDGSDVGMIERGAREPRARTGPDDLDRA